MDRYEQLREQAARLHRAAEDKVAESQKIGDDTSIPFDVRMKQMRTISEELEVLIQKVRVIISSMITLHNGDSNTKLH